MKENNSKSDSKQQNVCRIRIAVRGPYMVFGMPPLAQQFIMPDSDGESWYFQQGRSFVQAGWQRPGDGREPCWLRGVRPEPEKSIQRGQQALAVMQSHGSRHTGKKDVLVRHA